MRIGVWNPSIRTQKGKGRNCHFERIEVVAEMSRLVTVLSMKVGVLFISNFDWDLNVLYGIFAYLEPVCPLFWGFNPPKQGPFQSKQGSFGFQVYMRLCFFVHAVKHSVFFVFFVLHAWMFQEVNKWLVNGL